MVLRYDTLSNRIKNHPLVPDYILVYGYIYDVKTGRLIEVPETSAVGIRHLD